MLQGLHLSSTAIGSESRNKRVAVNDRFSFAQCGSNRKTFSSTPMFVKRDDSSAGSAYGNDVALLLSTSKVQRLCNLGVDT